jgi:uncharacterized membrane protein YdjX (TVP38/TMEM64 family)
VNTKYTNVMSWGLVVGVSAVAGATIGATTGFFKGCYVAWRNMDSRRAAQLKKLATTTD